MAKIPDALAALRGFPSKDKARRERGAVKPRQGTAKELAPPSWLPQEAQAEWRRLQPELARLGLLTHLDLAAFAAYCVWLHLALEATKPLLKKKGSARVKPGSASPFSAARAAWQSMRAFGACFGLSPSDRVGLAMPLDPTAPRFDRPKGTGRDAPAKPRDEFEKFMKAARRRADHHEEEK